MRSGVVYAWVKRSLTPFQMVVAPRLEVVHNLQPHYRLHTDVCRINRRSG